MKIERDWRENVERGSGKIKGSENVEKVEWESTEKLEGESSRKFKWENREKVVCEKKKKK